MDDQHVELGGRPKVDRAAAGEVFLGQLPDDTAPAGQRRDDLVPHLQEPGKGVAQKDQAHDGHEVFVAGEVRVGAELVPRAPETLFDVGDLVQAQGNRI